MKWVLPLVAALIPALSAASPTVRYSWGTCDPPISDKDFLGPAVFNLVVSGAGIPAGTYDSYEMRLWIVGAYNEPIRDAWRFDEAGCQGNSMLSVSTAALGKFCPALAQGSFSSSVSIDYLAPIDPANTLGIQLNVSGGPFTVNASTRYTLWQIRFDESLAVVGPTQPPNCGGAEYPLCFVSPHVTLFNGQTATPLLAESPVLATFNGGGQIFDLRYGCFSYDPAKSSTWGRVKASYH